MGKVEKGIVLFVLFLVAVILGVSLNSDSGVAVAASGPLSETIGVKPRAQNLAQAPKYETGRRTKRAPTDLGAPAGTESRRGTRDARLLSSTTVRLEPEAEVAQDPIPEAPREVEAAPEALETPEAAPVPTRSMEGLEATLVEGLMLYTWRQGDTYASVASTYLGAGNTGALRKANEDRSEESLRPGDRILVPTDLEEAMSSTLYTVVAGDVLGTISTKVYGTSRKWRQIFDANRDVLASANSLKVGQVLRIPSE